MATIAVNSLPKIKSKYNGVYLYENDEYFIKNGELFYLLAKKSDDWWLCTRCDENYDPFFVPSSYVTYVDNNDNNNAYNNDDILDADRIIDDLEDRLNKEAAAAAPPKVKERNKLFVNNRAAANVMSVEEPFKLASLILSNNNNNNNGSVKQEYDYDYSIDNDLRMRKASNNSDQNLLNTNTDEDYDDDINGEEEEDDADEDDDKQFSEQNDDDSRKDSIKSQIQFDFDIPNYWLTKTDSFNRRVFYNQIDNSKWYLAANDEGTPYFYNNDHESIWQLPEIKPQDAAEQQQQQPQRFTKSFDEELSTFNIIYTKNTTTKKSESEDVNQVPPVNYNKPPEMLSDKFKVVKIVEDGKKCRKKSSELYQITMATSKLLFVKESKSQSKLEFHIDFKGGKCYKCDPKDKEQQKLSDYIRHPKTTFIVDTLNGNKIAFVHENKEVVDNWVNAINAMIKQHQSEFSPVYEEPQLLHSLKINDEKPMKKRDSIEQADNAPLFTQTTVDHENNKKNKKKQPLLSSQNNGFLVEYHEPTSQQQQQQKIALQKTSSEPQIKIIQNQQIPQNKNLFKLKEQLIAFFKRRPTVDQLKQRGIIQECIFGSNLINLCNRERNTVPLFLTEIIRVIEKKGLDVDGLYRISGNLSDVQKLRCQVDQGKYLFDNYDIHVLAGGLKTFFRELEDPLIPTNTQERFFSALVIKDRKQRFSIIKDLIKQLPQAHRDTLLTLCVHLLSVIELSSQNRMHLQNISLVFGPTLLRVNPVNAVNNGFSQDIIFQNDLVEYILANFYDLYDLKYTSQLAKSSNL